MTSMVAACLFLQWLDASAWNVFCMVGRPAILLHSHPRPISAAEHSQFQLVPNRTQKSHAKHPTRTSAFCLPPPRGRLFSKCNHPADLKKHGSGRPFSSRACGFFDWPTESNFPLELPPELLEDVLVAEQKLGARSPNV